jgi:hypothetical protein
MMRGNEARHDDRTGAVDHFRIAGGEVGSDGRDLRPVDQDVGFLEVTNLRVETEHRASSQHDAATPAVADEASSVGIGRGAQTGQLRRYCGGESCCSGFEKLTAGGRSLDT